LDDLTFDEQFDGTKFDPNLPIMESFDRKAVLVPDFSAGLNYRFQKSSRTKADIGVAAFHLNNPRNPFYTDDKSVKLLLQSAP
jgi:hypothetical protein